MKGSLRIILSLLFLLIHIIPAYSAEKMRIAIMDFKAKGVSTSIANTTSELIRTEMINTGKYIVIERAQMGTILKEQGFQQAGCTDISCAVELGKILSAKKILLGTVMKLGKMIIINGRIVDVEKGVAEFGQKQNASSEDDLYRAVSLFSANLTKRIRGNNSATITETTEIEEEKDDLPPIDIPGTRVTVAGTILMPQGKMADEVSDQGMGLSANFIMQNVPFRDSLFMVNATYAILSSNAEWVDKVDYANVSLSIGYPMSILRRFTLTPYIGGGYIMFTSYNDPYGYNASGTYSYEAARYFDPMAAARLELSIIFTPSIQLVLTPAYIFYFEKSGTQQLLTGDIGFRFSF